VRLEGLDKLKKFNGLIWNRTSGLLACSIVPQSTTLFFIIKVQSVSVTVVFLYATARTVVQHRIDSQFFAVLFPHLVHTTTSLFSFGRPVQKTLYFKSTHLSLRSAGPTAWHTTDRIITSLTGCSLNLRCSYITRKTRTECMNSKMLGPTN
jgi:general stress protein CsbA